MTLQCKRLEELGQGQPAASCNGNVVTISASKFEQHCSKIFSTECCNASAKCRLQQVLSSCTCWPMHLQSNFQHAKTGQNRCVHTEDTHFMHHESGRSRKAHCMRKVTATQSSAQLSRAALESAGAGAPRRLGKDAQLRQLQHTHARGRLQLPLSAPIDT